MKRRRPRTCLQTNGIETSLLPCEGKSRANAIRKLSQQWGKLNVTIAMAYQDVIFRPPFLLSSKHFSSSEPEEWMGAYDVDMWLS